MKTLTRTRVPKALKGNSYFHCACVSRGDNTNPQFKHYFRVYRKDLDKPRLVMQGGAEVLDEAKKKFGLTQLPLEENPYPLLD